MLRDRPHLCNFMPRRKDARRLPPDPDHEPDLYLLSRILPIHESNKPTGELLLDVHRPYPRESGGTSDIPLSHAAAASIDTPAAEQQQPSPNRLSISFPPASALLQNSLYQTFPPTQSTKLAPFPPQSLHPRCRIFLYRLLLYAQPHCSIL